MPTDARTVVLVEGESDMAALRTVCWHAGLDPDHDGFRLVSMGGVTNVGRYLRELREQTPPVRVLGLCDAGEAGFVVRALQRAGLDVEGQDDLERHGFAVCDRDLEDELIRALGPDEVLVALDDLALLGSFRTLQQQPDWRDRDVTEQLHRFAGVASGRKALLAEHLARRLTLQTTPAPLAALVAELALPG